MQTSMQSVPPGPEWKFRWMRRKRRRWIGYRKRAALSTSCGGGVWEWGNPIPGPREADDQAREAARQGVGGALNDITAEADRLCGSVPVEPDTVAGNSGT